MKGRNSIIPFVLIGIGLYFLLKQFNIPFLTNIFSWQALLLIGGVVLIFFSLKTKNERNMLGGFIVLGLGIHFYGLKNYSTWIDHWAVYTSIIGISLMLRSIWTSSGLISGLFLTGFSLFMIIPIYFPNSMQWLDDIQNLFQTYWPLILIFLGVYLLLKRR